MANAEFRNPKSQIISNILMPKKYTTAISQVFEILDFGPWGLFGIEFLLFGAWFSFRIPHSEFRI
jgi:hypothetical protein